MSTIRKTLAFAALVGLAVLAAHSGLLEQTGGPGDPKRATATAPVDEHGENGSLPADPSPPQHALKPSKGLTATEQRALKAHRIYLHAPITLGPIEIQAAGHRARPALLVTHTGVPVDAARTALTAARYAYSDSSRYRIKLQGKGQITQPGRGPVATAAARAVRRAVEIQPSPGTTTISLPSIIDVSCQRQHRRRTCAVQTIEFLADRTTTTTSTHLRNYQATVRTRAGRPQVTKITAGQ